MTRTIKTNYYKGRTLGVQRTNSGTDSNRAVANCILHMQVNHYPGCILAEVYDEESGQLHAVVRRSPATGTITIVYKRDPEKFETRLALGALLKTPKK